MRLPLMGSTTKAGHTSRRCSKNLLLNKSRLDVLLQRDLHFLYLGQMLLQRRKRFGSKGL